MMSKSVAIIGAGVSGYGAAILAKKKGYDVFVSDRNKISNDFKKIFLQNNIAWEEGKHSINKLLKVNEVIKSPGISINTKELKAIKANHIPIISEIEFAFRYSNAKVVSITGSNGKTTTSLLLGHILKKAGFDVLIAGNIGVSFALSISERDYKYIVLELSSFQLDDIKYFRSEIAIILNITPDHLNRYNNNFKDYIKSKKRITENQISSDSLIFNYDDPNLSTLKTKAKKYPFSILSKQIEGGYLNNNKLIINQNNIKMTIQELALQGKHNIYNSMAASIAARVFEVKDSVIRKSLMDFQNIEHRLEYVLTVHGIDFINDSKATNVNSCWFALESMKKDVIWIVGGVDKGNDYLQLNEMVLDKVKAIICLGKNNNNIIEAFKDKVDTIVQASSMKEAVTHSYTLANKGEVVLLSPACASFDLFDNFEQRGFEFKKAVRSL